MAIAFCLVPLACSGEVGESAPEDVSQVGEAATALSIQNDYSGLYLVDPGYSTTDGTQWKQWTWDGGSDDYFTLTQQSDGTYTITNTEQGVTKCMSNFGTCTGVCNVGQWTCQNNGTGDSTQRWHLTSVGTNQYRMYASSNPNYCASFGNQTSSNTLLTTAPCGSGNGQTFNIALSNTITANNLDDQSDSSWGHWLDGSTGSCNGSGTSGWTGLVTSPTRDGQGREFDVTFACNGGYLWYNKLGGATDASATHFVYDTYVYLTNSSKIKNLEFDMNQTLSDGTTIIYGFQCSGWNGVWEYTLNSGGTTRWYTTSVGCNPGNWSSNTWHHVTIASHRDNSGNATYDYVKFDGTQYNLGVSGYDRYSLGWPAGELKLNFQIDGNSSACGCSSTNSSCSCSTTAYLDNLSIQRW